MGQEMADLRQSQCEEAKEAAKGSTGSSGVSAMECQQLVQPPLQTPNSNSLWIKFDGFSWHLFLELYSFRVLSDNEIGHWPTPLSHNFWGPKSCSGVMKGYSK